MSSNNDSRDTVTRIVEELITNNLNLKDAVEKEVLNIIKNPSFKNNIEKIIYDSSEHLIEDMMEEGEITEIVTRYCSNILKKKLK